MKKFAFATRHNPTPEQVAAAAEKDIELVPIGDVDGFTVTLADIAKHGDFDGVVVVHAGAALQLVRDMDVGVFENVNRAPEGEKPQFVAGRLHVWSCVRQ